MKFHTIHINQKWNLKHSVNLTNELAHINANHQDVLIHGRNMCVFWH